MSLLLRIVLRTVICVLFLSLAYDGALSQTKQARSLQAQVRSLQAEVKKLKEHQRDLEARIAVLERVNLVPSPAMLTESYLRSARDAIINDINNLSANAYQYKIRPTTMGGGGGSYTGYTIPKRLSASDYATYSAEVMPDSMILTGTWSKGNGSVRAGVSRDGRPGGFVYLGEFE